MLHVLVIDQQKRNSSFIHFLLKVFLSAMKAKAKEYFCQGYYMSAFNGLFC